MRRSRWGRLDILWLSSALALGCSDAGTAQSESPGTSGSDSASGGSIAGAGGAPGTAGTSGLGGSTVVNTGGGGAVANGGAPGMGGAAGASPAADGGAIGKTKCASAPNTTLPNDAPALTAGVWKDISPSMVTFGNNVFTQGLAVDPCNTATLYLTVSGFDATQGGLFKSTNAGASWMRIAKVIPNFTGIDHLDEPIRIRVDPKNPQHLYAGDGVRGGTSGFWRSTDGGATFDMPATFSKFNFLDVYDVAADPSDFNHVLVSFHSTYSAAVLESKDGGDTWTAHDAQQGWGSGHAINFLYAPELGIGDSQTWLLGMQGPGQWRTADGGKTWTKVSDTSIQHGGGTIYYTKAKVLFASGNPHNLRSTDNGLTWTEINDNNGYTAIFGDGTNLYTEKIFGPAPFITSPETDGTKWTDFAPTQQFVQGPFEMGIDPVNGILYTASWNAGMWAMKLK